MRKLFSFLFLLTLGGPLRGETLASQTDASLNGGYGYREKFAATGGTTFGRSTGKIGSVVFWLKTSSYVLAHSGYNCSAFAHLSAGTNQYYSTDSVNLSSMAADHFQPFTFHFSLSSTIDFSREVLIELIADYRGSDCGPVGSDFLGIAKSSSDVYSGGIGYDAFLGTPEPGHDLAFILYDQDGPSSLSRSSVVWTQVSPTPSPSPRAYYAMGYDLRGQNVLIFGGMDNSGHYLSDTWTWDGTNWTQRFPTNSPPARAFAAMAFDVAREQMVLFGGEGDRIDPNSLNYLDDTWTWDGTNWTQHFPATQPSGRIQHSLVYDRIHGQTLFFGGGASTFEGPGIGSARLLRSDTWTWDGTNWTQQFPTNSPPRRFAHAMAYDSNRRQAVLFGGDSVGGGNGVLSDTWTWDGTNWTQQGPATPPPARWHHGMAFDTSQNLVLLFGGATPSVVNDTWTWNGFGWTQQSPTNVPGARQGHTLAYNSHLQQFVMFSGSPQVVFGTADTWVGTAPGVIGGCNPPQSITAIENDSYKGMVRAVVTPLTVDSAHRAAKIKIVNNLRWWLGVQEVFSSSGSLFGLPEFTPDFSTGDTQLFAANNLALPCKSYVTKTPPFFGCTAGETTWVANFCGSGTVVLTFGITTLSAAITIVDVGFSFPGLAPQDMIAIAGDILNIPDIQKGITCITSIKSPRAIFTTPVCLTAALTALVANSSEMQQMQQTFKNHGHDIATSILIDRLTHGIVDIGELAGDNIVLYGLTGFTGALPIELKGQ